MALNVVRYIELLSVIKRNESYFLHICVHIGEPVTFYVEIDAFTAENLLNICTFDSQYKYRLSLRILEHSSLNSMVSNITKTKLTSSERIDFDVSPTYKQILKDIKSSTSAETLRNLPFVLDELPPVEEKKPVVNQRRVLVRPVDMRREISRQLERTEYTLQINTPVQYTLHLDRLMEDEDDTDDIGQTDIEQNDIFGDLVDSDINATEEPTFSTTESNLNSEQPTANLNEKPISNHDDNTIDDLTVSNLGINSTVEQPLPSLDGNLVDEPKIPNLENDLADEQPVFTLDDEQTEEQPIFTLDNEQTEEQPVFNLDDEPAEEQPVFNLDDEPAEEQPIFNLDDEPAEEQSVFNLDNEQTEEQPVFNLDNEQTEEQPVFNLDDEPAKEQPVFNLEGESTEEKTVEQPSDSEQNQSEEDEPVFNLASELTNSSEFSDPLDEIILINEALGSLDETTNSDEETNSQDESANSYQEDSLEGAKTDTTQDDSLKDTQTETTQDDSLEDAQIDTTQDDSLEDAQIDTTQDDSLEDAQTEITQDENIIEQLKSHNQKEVEAIVANNTSSSTTDEEVTTKEEKPSKNEKKRITKNTNTKIYIGLIAVLVVVIVGAFIFMGSGLFKDDTKPDALGQKEIEKNTDQKVYELKEAYNFSLPKNYVALTFTNGPSEYTDDIAQILHNEGIGATFFFIGDHMNDHQKTIEQLVASGYSVGHATEHYSLLTRLTEQTQEQEILGAKQKLENITKKDNMLFRPPYNRFNEQTKAVIEKNKLRVVSWSVDANEARDQNKDAIIEHIKKKIVEGAIINFEESYATVEALPTIIDYLRGKNLTIVTLK